MTAIAVKSAIDRSVRCESLKIVRKYRNRGKFSETKSVLSDFGQCSVYFAAITVKMNSIDLGKLVRKHRKTAGLTQAELAKLAGVGKTVVFDIEQGKASVRFDTLLAVLSPLSINVTFSGPLPEDEE